MTAPKTSGTVRLISGFSSGDMRGEATIFITIPAGVPHDEAVEVVRRALEARYSPPTVRCRTCFGIDVQVSDWVNPNTGESAVVLNEGSLVSDLEDLDASEFWCKGCLDDCEGVEEIPEGEPVVDTNDLARRFAELLETYVGDLGAGTWEEMRRKNAQPKYEGCCASHDYCDANEVMLDVIERLAGVKMPDADDLEGSLFQRLWNRVWAVAKREHLTDWSAAPKAGAR